MGVVGLWVGEEFGRFGESLWGSFCPCRSTDLCCVVYEMCIC